MGRLGGGGVPSGKQNVYASVKVAVPYDTDRGPIKTEHAEVVTRRNPGLRYVNSVHPFTLLRAPFQLSLGGALYSEPKLFGCSSHF